MNTFSSSNQTTKSTKRSSWRWWQSNKIPDPNISKDIAASIAPSSLLVHHSIHSKESVEILSTDSIKSKSWISQKLKSAGISHSGEFREEEGTDIIDHNNIEILQPENNSETNSRCNKIINGSSSMRSKEPGTPSSSLLNDVHSITSSTIPVVNFNPNERCKKTLDTTVFSGIRAKFGKWVNKTDK